MKPNPIDILHEADASLSAAKREPQHMHQHVVAAQARLQRAIVMIERERDEKEVKY